MSKTKKIALSLLIAVGVAVSGHAYKNYREGLPFLKNHCYVSPEDGTALLIGDAVKVIDKNGKEIQVYVGTVVLGPFSIKAPLDIRKTNKMIPAMVKAGKLEEVNCETGQPLGK